MRLLGSRVQYMKGWSVVNSGVPVHPLYILIRQTDKQTDRQSVSQSDRQTDRQRERERERDRGSGVTVPTQPRRRRLVVVASSSN